MLERIDGGSAPAPQTQDYHPETDTQASAPVKQQGGQLQTTYTVQRGDSLGEVAARYQTSTQAIPNTKKSKYSDARPMITPTAISPGFAPSLRIFTAISPACLPCAV